MSWFHSVSSTTYWTNLFCHMTESEWSRLSKTKDHKETMTQMYSALSWTRIQSSAPNRDPPTTTCSTFHPRAAFFSWSPSWCRLERLIYKRYWPRTICERLLTRDPPLQVLPRTPRWCNGSTPEERFENPFGKIGSYGRREKNVLTYVTICYIYSYICNI